MQPAEEAIVKVFQDGKEVYIPCRDKPQQESIRVMAYNLRKRMPSEIQEAIGITKAEEDGILYVKVYKRDKMELLERDPDTGKLVPMQKVDPEMVRIIEFMRKDGKSEEEIRQFLEEQGG